MNVKSTIFKKKKKLSKFDESMNLSVVPNNNNNNNNELYLYPTYYNSNKRYELTKI